MKKISKKAFDPIDKEERDLMESIEHDEWRPVKNINQKKPWRQPETQGQV